MASGQSYKAYDEDNKPLRVIYSNSNHIALASGRRKFREFVDAFWKCCCTTQNSSTRRRTHCHSSPASSEELCCVVLAKPKRLSKLNEEKSKQYIGRSDNNLPEYERSPKQLRKEIQYHRREALKHSPAAKQTLLYANTVKQSKKKRLSDALTPEEAQVVKPQPIAIVYHQDEQKSTTIGNNDGSVKAINKIKNSTGCRKPTQSKDKEDQHNKKPPRAPPDPELSGLKAEENFIENKLPTKKDKLNLKTIIHRYNPARLTRILPKFENKIIQVKRPVVEVDISAPPDPFANLPTLNYFGTIFAGNADLANNKSALEIAAEEALRERRASAHSYQRRRANSVGTTYQFQSFTDSTTKIDQLGRNDSSRKIDHYSRPQSLVHGAENRTLEPRIFEASLNDPKFNIHFAPYYRDKKSNIEKKTAIQHHKGETPYYPVAIPSAETYLNLSPTLKNHTNTLDKPRELPQYGHKQWQSYFGRTFDVYTKLWKFQQLHRTVLDNKYGLKRWQIGEIASKIGQLYYHFYLRTSETAYLNEAYSFYSAIRGRSYYTKASKEDKCELMVKKLRYYARFIVVCLLLKKLKLVSELIRELDKQIVEYGNAYDPEDQAEWTVVVNEVKAFIKAEPVVSVIHPDNYSVTLSHRMNSSTPVERLPQMILTLQEVLIVGSNSAQVKFSELTIDMFRMMQTLEREPTTDIQHMFDDSPPQQFMTAAQSKGHILESGLKYGENPHKYLLFKPSPSQIFVYLASGFNEMPLNGVLMLYISADGLMVPQSKLPEDAGGYEVGGLITTSKTDISYRESIKDGKPVPPKNKEPQVLHPGDLYAFTRRPLFLIIDSDNSVIFQNMPRHFGQPLVILMSPLEVPACLHVITADKRVEGSLFTLFLHCPLSAICHYCDIREIPLPHWQRAQAYIEMFLTEASQIMTRSRPESMYAVFMGDDFLRLLILRFIMCETVMRMHRAFRSRSHLTRCSPPLSDDLFEHPVLTHIVMDLALHLQVRTQFHEPAGTGPPSNRE